LKGDVLRAYGTLIRIEVVTSLPSSASKGGGIGTVGVTLSFAKM
jgi:hypothetical protein